MNVPLFLVSFNETVTMAYDDLRTLRLSIKDIDKLHKEGKILLIEQKMMINTIKECRNSIRDLNMLIEDKLR